MNRTCLKEKTSSNSYMELRMEQIEKIKTAHSKRLFGYGHASIKEIRTESIRRRLEAVFNA